MRPDCKAFNHMYFTYTAKSSTGDIQTGQIDADDVEQVKRALREKSLFPIDIRKKGTGRAVVAVFVPPRHDGDAQARLADRHDAIGDYDQVRRRFG